MRIKNHFQINGFALSVALKQKLEATWYFLTTTGDKETSFEVQCPVHLFSMYLETRSL